MGEAFEAIKAGLDDAIAYAKGDKSRATEHKPLSKLKQELMENPEVEKEYQALDDAWFRSPEREQALTIYYEGPQPVKVDSEDKDDIVRGDGVNFKETREFLDARYLFRKRINS